MKERLRDFVNFEGTSAEIVNRLSSLASAVGNMATWITSNRARDEEHLVIHNLLTALHPYVEIYRTNTSGPIPMLALCTRSAYELNVRVRLVLKSPDNIKAWMSEAADDRIDLLKAIIEVSDAENAATATLRGEILRCESLKRKYNLPDVRKADTRLIVLATEVGLEDEHKALFKLFSKLVHPTSYLVNGGNALDDQQVRNVLLIHLQLYTIDTLKRVADKLVLPPELLPDLSR
jgi:hypothetical protein